MDSEVNMKKILSILAVGLLLSACSHTVRLPINNFATPIAGNGGFEGHISAVYEDSAKVSFVQNPYSANPTNHAEYGDDSMVDILEDSLTIPNLGYFLQISPINSVDIYRDSGLWGAKWQFKGHNQTNTFAMSLQAGYGAFSDTTEQNLSNTDYANSEHTIKQFQYGLSAGYVWQTNVAYISIIKNNYDVETELTNRHGNWTFNSKGSHTNAAVGLSSVNQGLEYGVEYTYQLADWKDSDGTDSAIGFKLGYRWK